MPTLLQGSSCPVDGWGGVNWGRSGFSDRKTGSGQDAGSKGPPASPWALFGSGLWGCQEKQLAFPVLGQGYTAQSAHITGA